MIADIVSRLRSVSITPFGRPVVPPVPTSIAVSSSGSSDHGSTGTPSSQAVRLVATGKDSSRQMTVVSLGRSGRIFSTSGRKARWKISAEQSNASSRSRFSAASLRGLIGHQIAPARAIPNTQANEIGLFADRIATLSPGRIPDRCSARPTCQENSRTSP